ncbi:MAG TPA: Holliday junction resolvase RuvX [Sandaracinaceae bacterium LLY-WYZ-13_1]|nr:Holliday junction resolvase RuvX [Sandaracinaceae bacterium LLY-WYZ-13_1]
MRRLGIDHGERRVGVAVSDEDGRIAHPRDTLARKDPKALIDAVATLAREEGARELVVGLPLHLDGSEGRSARRARRFAERLGEASGLPVVLWDERLTTAQTERALGESGVRGKARRRVVDRVAASLMLQSYLDSKREDEPWRARSADDVAEPAPADRGGRRRRRDGTSRGR